MWVTTLPQQLLPTGSFVLMAHGRWDIGNKAFNELTIYWHADHVYKHTVDAIEAFWLITMLAYNLFHSFHYAEPKAGYSGGLHEVSPGSRHSSRILCGQSPCKLSRPLIPLRLPLFLLENSSHPLSAGNASTTGLLFLFSPNRGHISLKLPRISPIRICLPPYLSFCLSLLLPASLLPNRCRCLPIP